MTEGNIPKGENIAEGLILSVISEFDRSELFLELAYHMHDTGVSENHVMLRIKAVTRNYINIRMHHLVKRNNCALVKNNRVRQKFNKLVLFNHQ